MASAAQRRVTVYHSARDPGLRTWVKAAEPRRVAYGRGFPAEYRRRRGRRGATGLFRCGAKAHDSAEFTADRVRAPERGCRPLRKRELAPCGADPPAPRVACPRAAHSRALRLRRFCPSPCYRSCGRTGEHGKQLPLNVTVYRPNLAVDPAGWCATWRGSSIELKAAEPRRARRRGAGARDPQEPASPRPPRASPRLRRVPKSVAAARCRRPPAAPAMAGPPGRSGRGGRAQRAQARPHVARRGWSRFHPDRFVRRFVRRRPFASRRFAPSRAFPARDAAGTVNRYGVRMTKGGQEYFRRPLAS
jgi:hypothetical protein